MDVLILDPGHGGIEPAHADVMDPEDIPPDVGHLAMMPGYRDVLSSYLAWRETDAPITAIRTDLDRILAWLHDAYTTKGKLYLHLRGPLILEGVANRQLAAVRAHLALGAGIEVRDVTTGKLYYPHMPASEWPTWRSFSIDDAPLGERVGLANEWYAETVRDRPGARCWYESIHHNALGNGWHGSGSTAEGASAFVHPHDRAGSRVLAAGVLEAMPSRGVKARRIVEANFQVLREVKAPRYLGEWAFMTTASDAARIMTAGYRLACATAMHQAAEAWRATA